MSASEDRLDSKTHTRVFRDSVIPKSEFNTALSHDRPKAIILGGQPGAGKGGLTRAASMELSGDVVTIDPDVLREYHPTS
ncbi:hypothetical protein EBB59_13320 [Lysobacter pythonis]|uniref:Zeta toxin domain-containing protein n=1 Tax=Solilutibacter pythonis TaxID=2483112 RepID=A0A3M2HI19_9GAMM|nr:zeta toxin family protein [Lysobacter pythonis]RMH87220.1 hypothetical protein EBB59_13320 [Lysobacter pythonis]